MKKLLLLCLLALVAPSSGAQAVYELYQFDVDDTTYVFPQYCTGPTVSVHACPGTGTNNQSRLASTAGVAATTVTSLNTDAALLGIGIGDVIVFNQTLNATTGLQEGPKLRKVTAAASADSITINSSIVLPTAGSTFAWFNEVVGTGAATDGWFAMGTETASNIALTFDQVSATGGITYKVECRNVPFGVPESATIIAGPTAVTAANTAARVNFDNEPWDQCRVGLKITTADDDGVLVASNTDDLDWNEYVNSYTVGASNDIDWVEDAGGTPNVCVIGATAATYTGAALATHLTTLMNAAACTPTNTYLVSYSTTTHKFTIARATGALTVDLLWNTGVNTATSLKTLLGYNNTDDTGSASYAADNATGETLFTANLDAGTYSGTSACVELAAEMNATASVTATYSCSYSADTDKITISATGITQLMMLWNTGTNTATSAGPQLGFPTAADSVGALTYTGAALDSFAASEIEKVSVTLKRGAR